MGDEKYTVECVGAEHMPPREGRSGLQVHQFAQTELSAMASLAHNYAEELRRMPGEFAAGARFAYHTMRNEAQRAGEAMNADWVTGQAVSERNRLKKQLRDVENELEHRAETIRQLNKRKHELSKEANTHVHLARHWLKIYGESDPCGNFVGWLLFAATQLLSEADKKSLSEGESLENLGSVALNRGWVQRFLQKAKPIIKAQYPEAASDD